MLSDALLHQLASATSTNTQDVCRPFVLAGCQPSLIEVYWIPVLKEAILFRVASTLAYPRRSSPPVALPTDRIVRLGDGRHLPIHKEICLSVNFHDSTGTFHIHQIWYSVLDDLSHDLIIGLVDLMGPYYDLFADAVLTSRRRSAHYTDIAELDTLTSAVQSLKRDVKDCPFLILSSRRIRPSQKCYLRQPSDKYHPRGLSRWYCSRDATPSPPMRG
jgi:hypothetical protein